MVPTVKVGYELCTNVVVKGLSTTSTHLKEFGNAEKSECTKLILESLQYKKEHTHSLSDITMKIQYTAITNAYTGYMYRCRCNGSLQCCCVKKNVGTRDELDFFRVMPLDGAQKLFFESEAQYRQWVRRQYSDQREEEAESDSESDGELEIIT